MKNLGTVFRFEYMSYVKRKSYIVTTVLFVVLVALALSFPRFSGLFSGGGETPDADRETQSVALAGLAGDEQKALAFFNEREAEDGYRFEGIETADPAHYQALVERGEYNMVVSMTDPLSYQRYVENLDMYDSFDDFFSELALQWYQAETLEGLGVDEGAALDVLGAQVSSEVVLVSTGKDQFSNFFYTYILIFLLYFAIIMYGQFVASSVATEKSTRAMELLITSTRPTSLMFGKVFGAGLAGFTQLALMLGSGYLFYNINIEYYLENPIIQSIFAMPLSILLYTLVFFVLGFFIYAFIYAALASLVSRMEDLSTVTSPVTFLFIAAFMIVMFSMAGGAVDSPLMIFCSYFPLTSPMAMFVRIAMSSVPFWQVFLSIAILVASTIGIGLLSTGIYRMGVLLYGNPPKLKEIFRMLRAQRKEKA